MEGTKEKELDTQGFYLCKYEDDEYAVIQGFPLLFDNIFYSSNKYYIENDKIYEYTYKERFKYNKYPYAKYFKLNKQAIKEILNNIETFNFIKLK